MGLCALNSMVLQEKAKAAKAAAPETDKSMSAAHKRVRSQPPHAAAYNSSIVQNGWLTSTRQAISLLGRLSTDHGSALMLWLPNLLLVTCICYDFFLHCEIAYNLSMQIAAKAKEEKKAMAEVWKGKMPRPVKPPEPDWRERTNRFMDEHWMEVQLSPTMCKVSRRSLVCC